MAKTFTKDKEDSAPAAPVDRLPPTRMPIVPALAKEFDVTADQWRVLIDQIFPGARTVAAIGMALAYCRARKLDIYKRPVHIVPMYSSALKKMVETVWPGISEIRTTAHRTGNYAGIDPIKWGDTMVREFKREVEQEDRTTYTMAWDFEYPEYAEATVYRMVEHQRMAFTATVYWEEAYATKGRDSDEPNEMWQKRPRGQLAKCAEAAALRMAFPEEIGNDYVAEEMEGKTIDATTIDPSRVVPTQSLEPPRPPDPTEPPKPPEPKAPLHKTDHPEGGKSEVQTIEGVEVKAGDSIIIASGADFNDDDSGVSTEPTTPDDVLDNLKAWLDRATDDDAVEQTWDELDIESEFAHDVERMGKAIDLKNAAHNRINRTAAGNNGQAELALSGTPAAGEPGEGGQ